MSPYTSSTPRFAIAGAATAWLFIATGPDSNVVSYIVANASWWSPHNSRVEVVIGAVFNAYPLPKYIHTSYRPSRSHVIVSCTPSRSHHFETEIRDTDLLARLFICAVVSFAIIPRHKSPFKTYRNHTIRHPICQHRRISSRSRYLAHSMRPVRDQRHKSCILTLKHKHRL